MNMANMSDEQKSFFLELFGDKRGVFFPSGNMQFERIDLSVAQTPDRRNWAGDFIYLDRNSTGVIGVQYNSLAMPPFPFGSNTAINGFPYETAYVSWAAQPGLFANVWYGYGASIIPPNQDISSILSTVNINDVGLLYSTAFSSNSVLGANVPVNIFSAASNTNNAVLQEAGFMISFGASGSNYASMLSKATAPVNTVDGDVHFGGEGFFTSSGAAGKLHRNVRIPSGKRLDMIAQIAPSSDNFWANYTL